MYKKSQSISINTIIIAAIALAVLVVLFFILTGRFNIFSEGVKSTALNCDKACSTLGYKLGTPQSGKCPDSQSQIPGGLEKLKPDEVCCCS